MEKTQRKVKEKGRANWRGRRSGEGGEAIREERKKAF